MGISVQILCENRGNESAGKSKAAFQSCYSLHDNNPMRLMQDGLGTVLMEMDFLGRKAKLDGWVDGEYGWVCPYCSNHPGSEKELEAARAGIF